MSLAGCNTPREKATKQSESLNQCKAMVPGTCTITPLFSRMSKICSMALVNLCAVAWYKTCQYAI